MWEGGELTVCSVSVERDLSCMIRVDNAYFIVYLEVVLMVNVMCL